MDAEPGEQVYFHGHPSWRAFLSFYLRGFVVSVLAGAAAGLLSSIASGKVETVWVAITVLAVFVAVLLGGLIKQSRTTYTITSRRLTVDRGLLARDLHETRLERVQNVNSRQSPMQRLLGVGTVDFDTAAGADYDFSFAGVAHPREIVRTVNQALGQFPRAGRAL